MQNYFPTARTADLVVQEVDKDILVFDLVTSKASCLNETAGFVWRNCDGLKTVGDIADELRRKADSKISDDLVWLAIDQLSRKKLLDGNAPPRFNGLSRREIIKQIGLGTAIALPVIASLVAPTAAHAQSLAPNGTVVGTFIVPGPGCTNATSRDNVCDTLFASLCASGNTDPSACIPTTGPGPYTVTCTCAP